MSAEAGFSEALDVLAESRGAAAPQPFKRGEAAREIAAALSYVKAHRAKTEYANQGERAAAKAERRRRREAYAALATDLAKAEQRLFKLLSDEQSAEPMVKAWEEARGEAVTVEEVKAAATEVAGWAAAAKLAAKHATGTRGASPGSEAQEIMSVLAGVFFRHTGDEPTPGDDRSTGDVPFFEFVKAAVPDLRYSYQDAGLAKALRTLRSREEWTEVLSWCPPVQSSAEVFGPSVA